MMIRVKKVKEAYLVPSSRYLGCSWVRRYRVAEIRLMMNTLSIKCSRLQSRWCAVS